MKARELFAFDKPVAISAVLLSLVGLLFIYSASSYSAELEFGDAFRYVKTQAVALPLGVACMLALSRVSPEKLMKWSPAVYIAGLAMLAAVFIRDSGWRATALRDGWISE